jgi:hypothetical protein
MQVRSSYGLIPAILLPFPKRGLLHGGRPWGALTGTVGAARWTPGAARLGSVDRQDCIPPMSTWQPLSQRLGHEAPEAPYEGVPPHGISLLDHWLEGVFGYRTPGPVSEDAVLAVATAARIEVKRTLDPSDAMKSLLDQAHRSNDAYLNVLDAALAFAGGSGHTLKAHLEAMASAWTVCDDGKGLQRRVDPTATEAKRLAASPRDSASGELKQAWQAIYGLRPDPSDGWDHAIKAVEAVLIPVVCPTKNKPTLSDVLVVCLSFD